MVISELEPELGLDAGELRVSQAGLDRADIPPPQPVHRLGTQPPTIRVMLIKAWFHAR
jgi:hypothetical protein